jgi:hypothetical protein
MTVAANATAARSTATAPKVTASLALTPTRAVACAAHSAEKASCARYRDIARLALGGAYRMFALSQRDADWCEARSAAEQTIEEISVIPGSTGNSLNSALLAEART